MKKKLLAGLLALVPALGFCAEDQVHLQEANIDSSNIESLQRGARLFVNYCLSCHSASMMRYERMGKDLEIPQKLVAKDLMFNNGRLGDTMTVAMYPEDAKAWFGTVPPDLSVIARARGVNWLYTYLHSFYRDPSKLTGVNNLAFPDVGMPNVLWELQGVQEPVITTSKDADGKEVKTVTLKLVKPGTLTPKEYDRAVRDLVNFLDYMGEPAKHERRSLGVKVILFLLLFLVVAYLMKRDYWKDVH